MKIILALFFFLLLLISCDNEKEKTYPSIDIKIDTIDNIEDKTIHLRYKDSSTMTTSLINVLTKEMSSHSFLRKSFDSSHTTYSKMKVWTANPPDAERDYYYYSENIVIKNSANGRSIKTENSVRLRSKNEIPYQKRLDLIVWPMNQLLFINGRKDSIITGSYNSDSISYQYKIKNYSITWSTEDKEDATIILQNTNDTIYMSLSSSIKEEEE